MPPVIAWVAGVIVAATGVSIAVATWIATLLVNGIIMFAAQKLLVKKPDLGNFMNDVAERQQMVRQSVSPRRIVYGRCKISGPLIYAQETGSKQFLHLVLCIATHECEAVEEVHMNDEVLTLDGSGNATGTYAGFVRVQWKLGTDDQTAFADLVTESGGVWNSNCRCRGNTLLYARVKFDPDKFPGGIPNFAVVLKGKKVYDPRTDTTAWTDNAGLCIYDYMRDTRFGLRAPASEFDEDALFATLNNCDEDVNGEKRYTINGSIDTDQLPEDILSAMLSSMAGRLVWAGGMWHLKSGYWEAATDTLTEVDMRDRMRVSTRTPRRDLYNGAKGTFVSETDHWQATDFVPYAPALYLTQDDNERLWRDLQFPFTLSGSTARRLAKIDVEKGRQQIRVNVPCKITALRFQCGDNIRFTHPRMGWTDKLFEVTGFVLTPYKTKEGEDAIGVDLSLQETASTVYDWDNGEDVTTDPSPNTDLPNPKIVANPTLLTLTSGSAVAHTQPDGTKIPRLLVEWTAPADQYVLSGGRIEVEYKKSSESTWLQWSDVPGSYTSDVISDVLAGVNYDVRIRSVNAINVHATSWVQELNYLVTGDLDAPDVPTGLTATPGTGKAVQLKWDHVSDDDRWEYGIYRNTTNNAATATKIAEVSANAYVDADVSTGTTYWYFITAIDTSENESAKTTGQSATPTEPAGAKLVTVTASSQIFQITNTGTVTPSGGITFTATGQNVSGSPTFDVTTGTATLTGSGNTRSLAYADMGTDVVTVTVTWDGTVDTVTVAKVREGQDGEGGTASVVGFLTNEAHVVPADSAGTVSSFSGAVTDFKVYVGLVDDTANWGFAVVANSGITGSFGSSPNQNRYTVTGLSVDTGYVDIEATRSGYPSTTKRFSVAKSRTGVDGAPSDPAAPTLNTSGAYLSGDGTVFSFITINLPSMPTGAKLLNVLFRRTGGSGWIVADQKTSGGGTVRIDDLSPGTQYDIAVQALNADGIGSNVVTATGSPFTAPNISTAPANPTGFAAHASNEAGWSTPLFWVGTARAYSGTILWTPSTSKDCDHYRFYVHSSSSTPPTEGVDYRTIRHPDSRMYYSIDALNAQFLWVQAVNRTGVAASLVYTGLNMNGYVAIPGGSLSEQNSTNVQVTAMKVGSGSSTSQLQTVMKISHVQTLTGGAATEDFNLPLTNRGFASKPTGGMVQEINGLLSCGYVFDAAGSTSSNAVIRVRTFDGSNISGGNYRFSVDLYLSA